MKYRKDSLLQNVLLMVLLSILLLFGSIWGLNLYTRHGERVIVPDVRGKMLEQAAQELKRNRLKVVVIDSVYTKKIAPGAIFEVSPRAGNAVKPGRPVYLTINAFSPEKKALPDVRDRSLRQAEATLRALKFDNITIKEVDGEYDDLCVQIETMEGMVLEPQTMVSIERPLVLVVTKIPEDQPLSAWDIIEEEEPAEPDVDEYDFFD